MALLGSFIDIRTLVSLASGGTVTFAHGLGVAPDFVIVQGAATMTPSADPWQCAVLFDTNNVTIQNCGGSNSPALRVMSVVAHSLIR